MRGKVVAHCVRQNAVRITPAYAGKRPGNVSGAHNVWDHPRVCGEKQVNTVDTYPPAGSPPRMRGKELFFEHCLFSQRITPAYAGKSEPRNGELSASVDHPRVCGEKRKEKRNFIRNVGSPPRMRGKAIHYKLLLHGTRITPAYAGKSWLLCWLRLLTWDHPRVCGEKTKKIP